MTKNPNNQNNSADNPNKDNTNNQNQNGIQKFTLYLGLNDKQTKTQKISTLEAFKIVNNLLINYVDGSTIYEADGMYKHNDGTFTIEKTLKIELLFTDYETVKTICDILKSIFNQESIAIQKEIIESELY